MVRSPNVNAFAERWAQSIQVECLDHFVVLGEKHLEYLISEYVEYFNQERPHQAMGNAVLTEGLPPEEGKSSTESDWAGCSAITTARQHEHSGSGRSQGVVETSR